MIILCKKKGGNRVKQMNLPRTDLALEAHEMVREEEESKKTEVSGVVIEEVMINGLKVTEVIVDKEGEKRIGKKEGHYVTIDYRSNEEESLQQTIIQVIEQFLHERQLGKDKHVLVVGLGNKAVTPDALGPKTVDKLFVTSHIYDTNNRAVSAIAPGVMGTTGLETSDIIHGLLTEVKPDFMIVVDALAARSVERVNATIQISDTGIHPGSGVGNKRKALDEETFGIPVIAIGIPTVVDAASIVSDTLDYMIEHIISEKNDSLSSSYSLVPSWMKKKQSKQVHAEQKDRQKILGIVGTLEEEEKRQFLYEVLASYEKNLMVTPKEVDTYIETFSSVLANSLNESLQR